MGTIKPEEEEVKKLDAGSPASFNLSVLNPDGSVFLLLSGGWCQRVIADEVHNLGLGKELANYGEYSGNPNTEETYMYTSQVLKLMLSSKAKNKVLFVGGAVANFTDIANTFAGVIRALDEYGDELKKQGVKYMRRGGPRQEIGLAKIKAALEKTRLFGGVYDPKTSIPGITRGPERINQMISLSELRKLDVKVICLGSHPGIIQSMLDYDFLIGKKEPSTWQLWHQTVSRSAIFGAKAK